MNKYFTYQNKNGMNFVEDNNNNKNAIGGALYENYHCQQKYECQ